MKILFYCNSIFTFGGVQRVLAVVASNLSQHHDVTILTLDTPDMEDKEMYDLNNSSILFDYISYPTLAPKEFYPCKMYSMLYKKILPHNLLTSDIYSRSSFPLSYQNLLTDKINKGKYDIVVGVHAFLSFHLVSISKKIRAKTIGWMHNSYQAFFEMNPSYLEGLKEHFMYQMPKLSKIVVLSKIDRTLYKRNLNLDPQVIYNPLTVSIKGEGSPIHKKFLAIGRFSHRHKGFDILIKAFAQFAQSNKEWNLEIVGEGVEEHLYRSLIQEYKLEKRIALFPFTKDIEKHYTSASVYVLSSRWEGFGLVQIEAMAHKLPVISSDIPIAKELFERNQCALIFRNEDINDLSLKLLQMAEQTDINQMGIQAYEYSQMFLTDKIMKQWEILFAEL